MTTWLADWTWRIGANSRSAMVYDANDPTNVRMCSHRHRSAESATRCAIAIAKRLEQHTCDHILALPV